MQHRFLLYTFRIAVIACALALAACANAAIAAHNAPVNTSSAPTNTDPPRFTIAQTLSDGAQRTTIAFDGLAFLSGSLGADSFLPPGKVADYWGFQYLRDNDPSEMGHNTDFLTKASLNMLYVLTSAQRAQLITLANSQVGSINEYAYKRFVLMKAFRRLLEGDLPAGTTGLDKTAVMNYSAELYHLDGQISYERAQVMGGILAGLDTTQRAYLDAMVGQGMTSWNTVAEPDELRGLDHDVKVAVMTYAGDLFSWYAGGVDADVYFCPERQGTYFGSFYMKDAPAVGNPGYSIGTNITADMGNAFLAALTTAQAQHITGLVETQRADLLQIVETRRSVSTELRKFIAGNTADEATVLALSDAYGALDGAIVYNYATQFAIVGQSLTTDQKTQLAALRTQTLGDFNPTGAFLYAAEIEMPVIPDTDFLFGTTTVDPTATPTLTPTPIPPTATPTAIPPTATALPKCTAAPAKPKLTTPLSGAKLGTTQIALDWADANCATTYKVTVRQGSNTGKIVDSAQVNPSAYQTKALARGKTYYWQVSACNKIGCTVSAWWNFKINP